MPTLVEHLQLSDSQATDQWRRILKRKNKKVQEPYTSVELILCYALFFLLDPHGFGGRNIDRVPAPVGALARLFRRSPSSITSKMLNLDRSRTRGATHDGEFYDAMVDDMDRFIALYNRVIRCAYEVEIDEDELPDFLSLKDIDQSNLLGQEKLSPRSLEKTIEFHGARFRGQHEAADPKRTSRFVEQRIRVNQNRFAAMVLENYDNQCAFCAFTPRLLARKRLLIASHIKPWAQCDDEQRLDVTNGIATCPIHDAAFDTGLITVTGDHRIHRAELLEESILIDPGVKHYFGRSLRKNLRTPVGGTLPGDMYLTWHNDHIYLNGHVTVDS